MFTEEHRSEHLVKLPAMLLAHPLPPTVREERP
jgi:hypothetical protein